MKNLANCKPSEFLAQTNKIRKSVSRWLTDTDILNIRKRVPAIPDDATEQEVAELRVAQARKNLDAMFDAMFSDYPDETLEVLALSCFIDPKDVDNYSMTEYIESFNELINNRAVLDFFTSLVRLANQIT